jgi:hypothetical protein
MQLLSTPATPNGDLLLSLHFSCFQSVMSGLTTTGLQWVLRVLAARTPWPQTPSYPRIALSLRLISSAGTRFGAKVHNNPLYRQLMLLALPFALVHRFSARWRAPWESNGETVLSHNSLST